MKNEVRNLKRLRLMCGKNQFWLSAMTRIERSRISLLENGHVQPTAEEKELIGRALVRAMGENMREFTRLSGMAVEL